MGEKWWLLHGRVVEIVSCDNCDAMEKENLMFALFGWVIGGDKN